MQPGQQQSDYANKNSKLTFPQEPGPSTSQEKTKTLTLQLFLLT